MTDRWTVRHTYNSTDELFDLLREGWEPYAAIWVPDPKKDTKGKVVPRDVIMHLLKRRLTDEEAEAIEKHELDAALAEHGYEIVGRGADGDTSYFCAEKRPQ